MGNKRLLTIGAAVLLLALFGPRLVRWVELKAQESQLKAEIAALKAENRRLAEEAQRLREDPAYAEAVARKELGLVRPGETVVKLKENRQPASSSQEKAR